MKQSQNQLILKYLQRGYSLTRRQADQPKFKNCLSLNSRISNLRAAGHDIKKEMVTKGGKTFAMYFMPKPVK